MTKPFVKAALAAALSACALSPALAVQADRVPTATIVYADLDLSATAGQRELDRRMRIAVRQVCPRLAGAGLQGDRHHRNCRRGAEAQAQQHREVLAARYRRAPATLLASQ